MNWKVRIFFFFCFNGIFGIPLNPLVLQSEECTVCEQIVDTLAPLWGDATLEDCTFELMTFICTAMEVEDHFICRGLVSDFRDTFIYVINEIIHEPSEVCGLVVEGCDGAFDPFNATWSVELPDGKPQHQEKPIPENKPTLKVLHLSDIHIDNDYIIGAEVECGEPMCCRPSRDANAGKANVKQPAGKWGNYGNCDSPYWLFKDMMENIAANHKHEIDYVVVSGDLESHADWEYTREGHQEKVRNISRLIKQNLPEINVYFTQGNHESTPIDAFAPSWTPEKYHMQWMYGTEATEWKDWLDDGALQELNFFLYINQTDPDGTMTWFVNQLYEAEKAGDKVQIVAHIPGGGSEALEGWAINYYRAVNRFEDTIVAQFFGHTHSEEHYMFYEDPEDDTSRPTGVSLSAPSVTPNYAWNPAYRIYTIDGNYDGSTFQVIDFEEYYLDLTEANANPDAPTQWKQLYSSVKAEYGLKSLTPAEWNNLIDRMMVNDTLYNIYRKNFYRRTDTGVESCSGGCKESFLCSLKQSHHSSNFCKNMKQMDFVPNPSRKVKKVKHKLGNVEEIMKRVDISRIQKFDSAKCPI